MPNITQYTNPDTSINTEGFSQAARRIGAAATQTAGSVEQAGRQLGQGVEQGANELGKTVEQHVDYWDQTRVLSQKTAVLADSEQKWQTLLKGTPDPNNPGKFIIPPADPTDKDLAARFMRDQVEPALQDLQKTPLGIHGADYAANQAGEIRQHLQTALTADMSSLAGKAVQISDERVKNNSAALIAADPSFHNVDMALKTMDQLNTAHSSVGTITADMAATLKLHNEAGKEELIHTAVAAAIERSGNPEQVVRDFTAKYPDYIKPAQEIALAKQARAQIKFNENLDRSARIQQKELDKADFEKQATALQNSAVNDDGTPKTVGPDYFKQWKALSTAPGADSEKMRALYKFGQEHDGTDHSYTDPEIGKKLADGVIDGTTTNIDLVQAFNDRKLSSADLSRNQSNLKLVDQLGEQKEGFQAAMKAVDDLTIDRTAGPDPLGTAISAKIKSQFMPAYVQALKTKTLPPNALDMTDPKSMIRQFIDPQLPTLKDRTQVQAFLAATGPQPEEGPGLLARAKAWFSTAPDNAIPVKDPSDIKRLNLAPGTAIKLPDGSIRYVPQPRDNVAD
jgi:hypothetical protein